MLDDQNVVESHVAQHASRRSMTRTPSNPVVLKSRGREMVREFGRMRPVGAIHNRVLDVLERTSIRAEAPHRARQVLKIDHGTDVLPGANGLIEEKEITPKLLSGSQLIQLRDVVHQLTEASSTRSVAHRRVRKRLGWRQSTGRRQ